MKKLLLVTCFSLIVSGCGSTETLPTSTPTPTTLSGFHPRCFMAPADRPRPEEHIPCPSGGGSVPPSETAEPSSTPSTMPSGTPTNLVRTTPLPRPRTPAPTGDIACLNGKWHQDAVEIAAQYSQALPSMDLGVSLDARIEFEFFPEGAFTETVTGLSVYRNIPNVLADNGMDSTEVKISGLAKGNFHKDETDGKIYFTNIDAHGVVSSMLNNGRLLMPEGPTDVSMMPGVPPTGVTARCDSQSIVMSFALSTGRAITVVLYKSE